MQVLLTAIDDTYLYMISTLMQNIMTAIDYYVMIIFFLIISIRLLTVIEVVYN